MRRVVACGMAGCLVFAVTFARGQTADPAAGVSLKTDRVALFKNGLGYFVTSGALPKKATTVTIGQLPVPSLGTFWIGYGPDVKLRSLVTALDTVEERQPAQNLAQLLQENVGRKVVVRTAGKDEAPIEGVVVKVAPDGGPREPPSPYVMDARPSQDPYGRSYGYGAPTPPQIAVIRTAQGLVALHAGSIQRVDFAEGDAVTTTALKLKRPSLRMELEKEAAGEKVSVSYLARGITWSPSYLLDISDGKTARLSAKALVINEVADLQNVALDLVTGFPNIKFAEVGSPLAMGQTLADFLNSLTTGRTEDRRRNSYMMTQQAMVMNAPMWDEFRGAPAPAYSTAAEGTVSEDLFLYPVKSFTLRKGETACLPLFTADVPYRHVYTWKIEDMLDENERWRRERETAQMEGKWAEEVWHCCRLQNALKMPLTTAAAEFVRDGQFVGQDVCYYTAPGSETTIRINRAMNLLAEQADFEVERKRNAAQFYGYSYDLVKVRCEMKVRNRLDKTVTLEVTRELSGEVLEKTPDARDIPTAKGLKRVNPRHVLIWNVDLKAAEETTLQCVYQVYIRG